jgi:hypothetical protein
MRGKFSGQEEGDGGKNRRGVVTYGKYIDEVVA